MPSGKRRMHSVRGRHDDELGRNASGVFLKAYEAFYNSDLYLVVTEIAEVHADIVRSFLKCFIPPLP